MISSSPEPEQQVVVSREFKEQVVEPILKVSARESELTAALKKCSFNCCAPAGQVGQSCCLLI